METSTMQSSVDYRASVNRHVFNVVPENSRCLDVGCWTGNLGRLLIEEKGCVVHGLDGLKSVLDEAKGVGYSRTYEWNLNVDPLTAFETNERYDVIIFADVLEHLVDPGAVLTFFASLLRPGGKIIVSLPNVAFCMNRLQLLFGRWEYKDFGILDKTHLKFYTLQSSRLLLEQAGLRVVRFRPYNQFGILRYLDPPPVPSLFAYQILLVATKEEVVRRK